MGGSVNSLIVDIGLPRHSTCDDIAFCAVLCISRQRSELIDIPLAIVECAVLGYYVGEGEGCCLALSTIQMGIGAQMATVQTSHLVIVIKDSLALFDLL